MKAGQASAKGRGSAFGLVHGEGEQWDAEVGSSPRSR